MFNTIAIGDSTLDVFLDIDAASVVCNIDKKACQLCFNYADKVPVKGVRHVYGVGNAANHAIGAARMGLKSAIYTIVGNDDSGKATKRNFKKEKVDSKFIVTDKKHGTNFSAVLNYQAERTILVFHQPRTYKLPKLGKSKWVYFSSVAAEHGSLYPQLVNHIKKTKAKLAFNPGSHQLKEGVKVLGPIFKQTEVLFVNRHEAQRLVGKTSDIKALLKKVAKLGPKLVMITEGPKGAYAYDGKDTYFQGLTPAKVVERTGAGDAFASGLIGALQYGRPLPEAMLWGTINSGGVLELIGAQAGLQTKSEIQKKFKKYSARKAKLIK